MLIMIYMFTKEKLLQRIEKEVAALGSQKAFADKIGITPAYLSDVLSGKREPGEKLLSRMGIHRVAMFEFDKESE